MPLLWENLAAQLDSVRAGGGFDYSAWASPAAAPLLVLALAAAPLLVLALAAATCGRSRTGRSSSYLSMFSLS